MILNPQTFFKDWNLGYFKPPKIWNYLPPLTVEIFPLIPINLKYIFPVGGLLKSPPNPFANVVEKRGTGCIHNAFKVGETKW